ncbi:MAG: type II toxin-antitoxin system VapB family antitoxin, partial [Flavobacteriales bacterium]|nr:type II toxin-antitoxin system VapB family antitoxin [Flavobacteriales bacterium]
MKTTIELPEALFAKAKRLARARKTTLKALIEQGLRMILAEQR